MRILSYLLLLFLLAALARAVDPPKDPPKGPNGETLVTLHLKDAFPDDAIIKLHDQTHLDFNPLPEDLWDKIDKKVSIDAEAKPLMAVLWDICAQSNLAFRTSPFEKSIDLIPATISLAGRPMYASGPLLFVPESITHSQSITYAKDRRRQDGCSIQFTIYQEPGLNVVAFGGGLELIEALDENGHSLLPASAKKLGTSPGYIRGSAINHAVAQLALAENAGKTLKSLKGTYTLVVPSEIRQTQFDDILAGKELAGPLGDFQITVKLQSASDAKVTLIHVAAVAAREGQIKSGDPRWTMLTHALNSARLVDAKGHSIRAYSAGISSGGAAYQADVTFPPPNPAVPNGRKLVIDLPLATKDMTLPFEFTNLPLP